MFVVLRYKVGESQRFSSRAWEEHWVLGKMLQSLRLGMLFGSSSYILLGFVRYGNFCFVNSYPFGRHIGPGNERVKQGC